MNTRTFFLSLALLASYSSANAADIACKSLTRLAPVLGSLIVGGAINWSSEVQASPLNAAAFIKSGPEDLSFLERHTASTPVAPAVEYWVRREMYWHKVSLSDLTDDEIAELEDATCLKSDHSTMIIIGDITDGGLKAILSRRADHRTEENHSHR